MGEECRLDEVGREVLRQRSNLAHTVQIDEESGRRRIGRETIWPEVVEETTMIVAVLQDHICGRIE